MGEHGSLAAAEMQALGQSEMQREWGQKTALYLDSILIRKVRAVTGQRYRKKLPVEQAAGRR